jgi:hypothetical protein
LLRQAGAFWQTFVGPPGFHPGGFAIQKIWHRQFDIWWYLTLRSASGRKEIKLVKVPDDRETKAAAEQQAVQEFAARQHVEDAGESAPTSSTGCCRTSGKLDGGV